MHIAFRVDADRRMGAGHAMRCLALAGELQRRNCQISFHMRRSLPLVNAQLRAAGIRRCLVRGAVANEAQQLEERWRCAGVAAVVLDGYQFKRSYQQRLRRKKRTLLYLTDYPTRAACDLLVCPTPGLRRGDFTVPAGARCLLGLRQILLRRELLRVRPRRQSGQLLVNFGASILEPALLQKAVTLLEDLYAGATVNLITGGNRVAAPLRRLLRGRANRYRLVSARAYTPALLAGAALAFTPASTTLWELAFLRVPVVCFYAHANQRGNATWLGRRRLAVNAGNLRTLTGRQLAARLRPQLRAVAPLRRRAAALRELIDGRGAARVAAALLDRAGRQMR